MKTTCSKLYQNFPAAHRQHNHDGHCALIHGHDWSFKFTFAADSLDENEFVVDFGKLKFIKAWLDDQFDHTLLLNEDDPALTYLLCKVATVDDSEMGLALGPGCFAKIIVVPNCGAEGLAKWVLEQLNEKFFASNPDFVERNVHIKSVEVFEDSKNSALVSL